MKTKVLLMLFCLMVLCTAALAELQLSSKTGAFPETYRNEVYQRTGERGCLVCHDDLRALAQRAGPIQHSMADLGRAYGKEKNVIYCLTCHNISAGGLGPRLGEAIHSSHTPKRGFEGDCFSCHAVKPDGTMVLWDRIKYDPSVTSGWATIMDDTKAVLAPLNSVRQWLTQRQNYEGYRDGFTMDPDFKGKISFNQNLMTDELDQFVAQNYGKPESFLPKDLKDYKITVTGPMAMKTKTYTLDDLKKFKQITQIFTRPCAINPPGGAMIYQAEFTGISTMDLLNDVGMKPGANYLKITAYDGWQSPASIKTVKDRNGQLTLKMRGKDMPAKFGGPVASAIPGETGGANTMWVKTIEIMQVDHELLPPLRSEPIPDVMETVNSGFLVPARDGTVVGKKATLEGWAYAWHNIKITRMLFSADNGRTWKEFFVPDNIDALKWINWKYEWEAPKAGVYLLKMKAVADGASVEQVTESNIIVVVK